MPTLYLVATGPALKRYNINVMLVHVIQPQLNECLSWFGVMVSGFTLTGEESMSATIQPANSLNPVPSRS